MNARPSVRTDRDGDRAKSAEIDPYVAALRLAEAEGSGPPDRKAVYADWCRGRLEAGGAASLFSLAFDGLAREAVYRRDADRKLKAVNGHSASVTGVLDVGDPEGFAGLLVRGLGRHRAFGFGMLLLSPP